MYKFALENVDQIYIDDNDCVRWKSNDRVPSDECIDTWVRFGIKFDPEKSKKVRKEEDKAFLDSYRERMQSYEPSEEELFEMKSAFGKDVTIVNVITGKSVNL